MIARVVVLIASLCGITHGAELGTLGRVTYYDQSGHTVPRERVCDIEPTPARCLTALHEHMDYPTSERSLRNGGERIEALGYYYFRFHGQAEERKAQVAHVWTIRDGRAVKFQQYLDTLQVARDAGTA